MRGLLNSLCRCRIDTDDAFVLPGWQAGDGMAISCFSLLFAYLDPGAGSLLMQAIVGGAAGFLVALRHFWKTFRAAGRSDISGGR